MPSDVRKDILRSVVERDANENPGGRNAQLGLNTSNDLDPLGNVTGLYRLYGSLQQKAQSGAGLSPDEAEFIKHVDNGNIAAAMGLASSVVGMLSAPTGVGAGAGAVGAIMMGRAVAGSAQDARTKARDIQGQREVNYGSKY